MAEAVVSRALERASAAQTRAARPEVSAWVSANAGAGKTHVLVNRVIRLLLNGTAPEKILCLTFTNAAAAEMANRLFEALGRWATAGEEELAVKISTLEGGCDQERLGRARVLFARALETPGGLKIQTLHAFCERLLQRFALEADVPPGFDVLDERAAAMALEDARRTVLGRAARQAGSREGRALRHISRHVAEDGFDKLMRGLTAKRFDLERLLDVHGTVEQAMAALAARLQLPADISEADIWQEVVADEVFPRRSYERAVSALAKGSANDRKLAARIEALLQAEDEENRFACLLAVYLTGSKMRSPRAFITRTSRENHPEMAAFLLDGLEQAASWLRLQQAVQVLRATEALLVLGRAILDHYSQAKARRGLLDYDDLIWKTHQLLTRSDDFHLWVMFKLDGGLEHILVDEAQDTSPEQWDIVNALSQEFFAGTGAREGPRTMFAVGDEKQSIYSFQGAEPARFAQMRDLYAERSHGAGLDWEKVDLELSFRSGRTVLKAVDIVFAGPAGAGLSSRGGDIRHDALRMAAGRVELWPLETPDEQEEENPWQAPVDRPEPMSPALKLAGKIARCIDDWLRAGRILPALGRPVRPGDILILVRTRTLFADAMVRALKRRGIAVAGADRMVLTGQLGVQDLLALGAFMLQSDDDFSLALVLKSPLAGLDDDVLFRIGHGRRGSLWQALRAAAAEEAHLAGVVAVLERWRQAAASLRPYEFFAGLLNEPHVLKSGSVRQDFIRRLGAEVNDPLDEFLAQCLAFEQTNVPGLQGFLDWMAQGSTQIKRDMEHGRDEVRVMTVHGAKGLEANIVFLPDTCSVPDGRHLPVLLSPGSEDKPLMAWTMKLDIGRNLFGEVIESEEVRQMEEYHRLLYVAMTRARDELYVCGYESGKKRNDACWYDLIHDALAGRMTPVAGADGAVQCWRLEDDGAAESERHDEVEAPLVPLPLPDWAQRPAAVESLPAVEMAPSRLPGPDGDGPPPVFSPRQAGMQRFVRGRLIHTLLQFLPELPAGQRRDRARQWLARQAPDLPDEAAGELIDEVTTIISDERFGRYFAPGSRAEVAFAALLAAGGERKAVLGGQVDRLAVSEQEVHIVDFKTNRPAAQRLEEVPHTYLRQMAAYRQALRRIYPGKAVRCALLWTDGPVLMELPDTLLDRHLPDGEKEQ